MSLSNRILFCNGNFLVKQICLFLPSSYLVLSCLWDLEEINIAIMMFLLNIYK